MHKKRQNIFFHRTLAIFDLGYKTATFCLVINLKKKEMMYEYIT